MNPSKAARRFADRLHGRDRDVPRHAGRPPLFGAVGIALVAGAAAATNWLLDLKT